SVPRICRDGPGVRFAGGGNGPCVRPTVRERALGAAREWNERCQAEPERSKDDHAERTAQELTSADWVRRNDFGFYADSPPPLRRDFHDVHLSSNWVRFADRSACLSR